MSILRLKILRSQLIQKQIAFRTKSLFELLRAVTVAARPRLAAVFVSAVAARMRVFYAQQLEIFFLIRPFFRQRQIAKACLDPRGDTFSVHARLPHVMDVFVAGD
jgi:hypothetical protein